MGLPKGHAERIRELFERSGLPTTIKLAASQRKKLVEAMRLDKKVSSGEIRFVLAREIGSVEFGRAVPQQSLERILTE